MLRFGRVILFAVLMVPSVAEAQRRVIIDQLGPTMPAAISCGFCANEKFGMIFRQLGTRGLQPSEFPLRLNTIQVAVSNHTVELETLSAACIPNSSVTPVSALVEAYAGVTPPSNITSLPNGLWPGETLVFSTSAPLTPSVEDPPGSGMYTVNFNPIEVPGGIVIPAPNTYIRVVVTVPSGGSSESCDLLGLSPPGIVGIRDGSGPSDTRVGFIRSVGGLIGTNEWIWNEADVAAGLWAIRLDVTTPFGGTDAGVPVVDAGSFDAGPIASTDGGPIQSDGSVRIDAGPARMDGGPMCTDDVDCSGGERCIGGMCRRLACTAATDCLGGMTCADGTCRNLCTSNAECLGGEICDTGLGHCVPVGTTEGGCGCHVGDRRSTPLAAFGLLALVGIAFARTRRRR